MTQQQILGLLKMERIRLGHYDCYFAFVFRNVFLTITIYLFKVHRSIREIFILDEADFNCSERGGGELTLLSRFNRFP